MDKILTTEDLCRSFGTHVAVDHLNLSVDTGQIYGLLGPNGAGKTTTIRMLNTLLPPSAGTAYVAGWDIRKDVNEIRRVIGSVPQALSVEGALTAYENLLIFAKLHRVPRPLRKERIAQMLELLQLTDRAHALVRTFSGGLIRRLELAQALVHEPRLLFLDEPTVGLDPIARRAFWDHLLDLRQRAGLSIIITTHYMEEAEALCDRVAIMHHGRIKAEGTTQELKDAAGVPEGTLEDVFLHVAGDTLEEGGDYGDVRRTRRTSKRLG